MSKRYHRIYPAPGTLAEWLAANAESGTSPVTSATSFAAYLQIKPETLLRWIKSGERNIPAYPIDSRRWAVPVDEAERWVEALLEEQRTRP